MPKREGKGDRGKLCSFSSSRIWCCGQRPPWRCSQRSTRWGLRAGAGMAQSPAVNLLSSSQASHPRRRAAVTPSPQALIAMMVAVSCNPYSTQEAQGSMFWKSPPGCLQSALPFCKFHKHPGDKRGDLSEAEHEALQRTLSIKNGKRREVFLSEGMYLYTPVCVHTHTRSNQEHRDAYRMLCLFHIPIPPSLLSLAPGVLPFSGFPPPPWGTLPDLPSPDGIVSFWPFCFPAWGSAPC